MYTFLNKHNRQAFFHGFCNLFFGFLVIVAWFSFYIFPIMLSWQLAIFV